MWEAGEDRSGGGEKGSRSTVAAEQQDPGVQLYGSVAVGDIVRWGLGLGGAGCCAGHAGRPGPLATRL